MADDVINVPPAEPTADTLDSVGQWILDNKTKIGTPEYVSKVNTYNALDPDYNPNPNGIDTSVPGNYFKAAEADIARRKLQSAATPNSASNIAGRVVQGAATGLPDLGARGYNSVLRVTGVDPQFQLPIPGDIAQRNMGVAPMPADASTGQQLAEAAGSTLLGGGFKGIADAIARAPTAARAILPALAALSTRTIAPTIGSSVGGAAGAAAGKAIGFDPEFSALIGSMIGGAGPGAIPSREQRTYSRYAGQGNADAAEIAAQARRQNVPLTAGMVGNDVIQARERAYGGAKGTSDFITERRTNATNAIGDALDRAAVARGSTNAEPTQGTIGEGVRTIAGDSAENLRARSSEGQQRLIDRVGAATPVDVAPYKAAGYSMMTDPQVGLSAQGRQALDLRLTDQLNPLITRQLGPGAAPSGPAPETVPYGPFKGYRSDLGRSIETPSGGRSPPASMLYGPATEAMRRTAEGQGVSPQDFTNVQGRTRQVEQRGGDYSNLTDIAAKEPSTAYNYMKGGEQNPDRLAMIEATQHPQVGNVMGDYLRMIGNDTVGKEGARSPVRLAERLDNMHPESRSTIAGPQLSDVNDIASLARSLDYATSKTGLNKALGSSNENLGSKLIMSQILGRLGDKTGIPFGGEIGTYLGSKIGPMLGGRGARTMQSPTAINAMAGGPRPAGGYGMADLAAALTAANAVQPRGP